MSLTCFQSLQWLIANSVIIMASKGPFLVKLGPPGKSGVGICTPLPPPPPKMAPLHETIVNRYILTF